MNIRSLRDSWNVLCTGRRLLFLCVIIGCIIIHVIVEYSLHHGNSSGGYHPNYIKKMSFNVLQYNIFGRPDEVSYDGQEERLRRIPSFINQLYHDIDVVTFAEADIESERNTMLSQFHKEGYNYSTTILKDPDPFTSLINGGILIVSKWPIVREAQHIYRSACNDADCLAAKGVKYARVNKTINGTSKIFNVFATHMQAWSRKQEENDRKKQAIQLYQLVQFLNLPHSEPILYAGDFNTDNISYPMEVVSLVETLHAKMPQRIGDQMYTSDPHSNVLVGRDGAASSNKCSDQYQKSWGEMKNLVYYPNLFSRSTCGHHSSLKDGSKNRVFMDLTNQCFCSCCPFEWLDYVLWALPPYQQPTNQPTIEAIVAKSNDFIVKWTSKQSNTKMDMVDLSDHYPVVAKFEFEVIEHTKHLIGCTNDNDCSFHYFYCFCTGQHCYYNGTYVNGLNYPYDHLVNKNCVFEKTGGNCLCGPN